MKGIIRALKTSLCVVYFAVIIIPVLNYLALFFVQRDKLCIFQKILNRLRIFFRFYNGL